MRKLTSLLSLSAVALLALSTVQAQPAQTFPIGEGYLFQEVAKDPALAQQFAQITEPLNTHFPWVAKYGTATPAESIKVDGKEHTVYQGCKPHNCPAESYVVVYSPTDKKMVAGAFVQNKYDAPNLLVESKISWLGQNAADFAPAISHYLY